MCVLALLGLKLPAGRHRLHDIASMLIQPYVPARRIELTRVRNVQGTNRLTPTEKFTEQTHWTQNWDTLVRAGD